MPASAPDKFGTQRALRLRVTNKFGEPVSTLPGQVHCNLSVPPAAPATTDDDVAAIERCVADDDAAGAVRAICATSWPSMDYDRLRWFVDEMGRADGRRSAGLGHRGPDAGHRPPLSDRRQETQLRADDPPRRPGADLRAAAAVRRGSGEHARADHLGDRASSCAARRPDETTLLIDARGFAPEGENCDATLAVKAYHLGWRHLVHYNTPRHAVPRRRASARAPTACGSTATTTRATTSARASTAWRSTSTATPRTSSARSASAASWSSTATWARRSSTAPRAARSTCWATPPAGR